MALCASTQGAVWHCVPAHEVRHGIGQKPKEDVVPDRTAPRPSPTCGRSKKTAAKPGMSQASLGFGSVAAERGDGGEDV